MNLLTTNDPIKYAAISEYYGKNNHYITQELKTKQFPPPFFFVTDEEAAITAKKKCNELITINNKLKPRANLIVTVEGGFHQDKNGFYILYAACKYENYKYNFGFANLLRISKAMFEVAKKSKLQDVLKTLSEIQDVTEYISHGVTNIKKNILECLFRAEKTTNRTGHINVLTVKDFSYTENFQKLDRACQNVLKVAVL